jgi:hypothetical protein
MPEFKRKKLLNPPTLKFDEGVTQFVKITGPMHLGKQMPAKEGEKPKEPATLAHCVNLADGGEVEMICNAVVESVLNEHYPNHAYVGKCFAITKGGRNPGKQYINFSVEEIEEPTETAEEPPKGPVRRVR